MKYKIGEQVIWLLIMTYLVGTAACNKNLLTSLRAKAKSLDISIKWLSNRRNTKAEKVDVCYSPSVLRPERFISRFAPSE